MGTASHYKQEMDFLECFWRFVCGDKCGRCDWPDCITTRASLCVCVCVSISCCGMQRQLSCVSEMAWLGWLSCFRALKQHSDMGCAHTQQHERMRLSHHEWHGVRQRAVVQKCEPIVHWVATWSRAIAGYGGDYVCYLLLKIVVMIVDFAIIVRIFFLFCVLEWPSRDSPIRAREKKKMTFWTIETNRDSRSFAATIIYELFVIVTCI